MIVRVVAALIEHDNKILLAQRLSGHLAGLWEFPGGKIEKGESEFDAIIREIKEELDVEVIPEKIMHTFNHKYPSIEVELVLVKCVLKNKKTEIKLLGSHQSAMWVQMKNNDLRLAPLDEKILKYLKRHLY